MAWLAQRCATSWKQATNRSFAAVENREQLVSDPGECHLSIVEHFAQQRAGARSVMS
jgi:hypothetical protein